MTIRTRTVKLAGLVIAALTATALIAGIALAATAQTVTIVTSASKVNAPVYYDYNHR